ncbi:MULTISPECIES: hypothetical protein [Sporomusa]|uniref:hypothetical protein n=1 Tax=Sporomusa TaxID=2375 RepID=UPI001664B94C|nr:hypothetical protein [Sporomusa sp. GT1]
MSIQKKQLFTRKIFPTTWVSLFLAVLLFPLGLLLPEWCGWENGLIENSQVAILIFGAFLSWRLAHHNRDDRQIHNLCLWMIVVWLMMVGRELSWGRVFFEPITTGPDGPTFPSIHAIWYGRYVYPVLTVIIISTLIGLWRNFNWEHIKQKVYISTIDGVLLIIAAIASQLIFERNLILLLKPYSQVLEELSELIVYWCMVSILMANGFQK